MSNDMRLKVLICILEAFKDRPIEERRRIFSVAAWIIGEGDLGDAIEPPKRPREGA